jgi:acyl dehydratase
VTNKRYWEDVDLGEAWVTPSRTVTEADVVMFAGLTGDFMHFHIDKVSAEQSHFGARVAHGLLGLSYLQGMMTWTETGIVSVGSMGWTVDFTAPIRIGDTLTTHFHVASKRETRHADRAIMHMAFELLNQDDDVVQRGEHRRMVRRRPEDVTPPA